MELDFERRHLKLEGCFNFRDIGGYPAVDGRKVRWGRYFRSGRQDRMTDADLATVSEIGIRTQIDLRRSDEIADQGRGPLSDVGARYIRHPVIPDGGTETLNNLVGATGISGERYLGYLTFDPTPWIGYLDLVASAGDQPLLIHCTAGKDRTGITTAFVLSILGVPEEIIIADYLLTNRDVPRQVEFVEANFGLPADMSRDALVKATGVPDDAMTVFLGGLKRDHGGPIEYLRSVGVTDSTFDAIRGTLLES
ncbi:MAG: hypothetical protein CMQ05_13750 [Gammaproteobacteria bacterium]|nr:hypothetical protein [Gammaproteobacteria bacterium]RPG23873.1 MAG: tyrosine-protein phosphatase [Gammaproteobacteria bacterium TMED50]